MTGSPGSTTAQEGHQDGPPGAGSAGSAGSPVTDPGTRLDDGRPVVLRPLGPDDEAALAAFGAGLDADDWRYLDLDLRDAAVVARLVQAHEAAIWRQVVAVAPGPDGERVLGYSTVRRLAGWQSHVADVHLVVAAEARRRGVGGALARATLEAARDLGVTKVTLGVLAEQGPGLEIFERHGFAVEGRLRGQVRDEAGREHDIVLLGLVLGA